MIKWALVGSLFVPIIIGANYLMLQNYYETAIGEARATVGAANPGTFTGVSFPHASKTPAPPPLPFKICGYINGQRFIYDARTRQYEVDAQPGEICDERYYSQPQD